MYEHSPLSVTKKMFDSFGWQTNLKVKPPPPGGFNNGQGSAKTLLGYFDCSKPPTIGCTSGLSPPDPFS